MEEAIFSIAATLENLQRSAETLLVRASKDGGSMDVYHIPTPQYLSYERERPTAIIVWCERHGERHSYHCEVVKDMTQAVIRAAELHFEFMSGADQTQ